MERSPVAIIIPAYNEQQTIGHLVERARLYGEVIVVDDGSTDATAKWAADHGACVVAHPQNLGYDAALNTGFAKAEQLDAKFIITMDGDCQHNPTILKDFVRHLLKWDLVLGVRPKTQRIAETLFARFTLRRYGVRDPLCGMKGYRMDLYRRLGHFDCYRSVGTELMTFALRQGASFVEIDIPVKERIGQSRFGNLISSNYRILRSLFIGQRVIRTKL